MNILYAPWREQYIDNTNKPEPICIFCESLKQNKDRENLILGRFKHNFVIMNKYPYNGGHLLIVPYEHLDTLPKLSTVASNELMELAKIATTILENELKNTGTNIGINMGKAAGAGIPGHLHTHVVPRWAGDTNFLPVLADAKQVSSDIKNIYAKLKPHFERIKEPKLK